MGNNNCHDTIAMKPHCDQESTQLEMERENSDEANKFLPSNETIHESTNAKYSKDKPQITTKIPKPNTNNEHAISISIHDINNESNSTADNYDEIDETAQLKDDSPQISVTDETKDDNTDNSDDEPTDMTIPDMPGQIYRQLTDGTITINLVFKIMGKKFIPHDMFQKSPYSQTSRQNGHNCNNTDRMVRYSELPAWHNFNLWIVNGYRNCECYSTKECVKSIIQNHNECGNIWTEFIPGIILIAIFIYQLLYNPSWILYIFKQHDCDLLARYAICYWISFMFILIRPFISGCAHWFHPISENSYNRWWKADYISIVWATMASASNFVACEFFCNFTAFGVSLFWLGGISLILTVVIGGSKTNENTGIREKALALMLCIEFWGSFLYSAGRLIHSWQTNNEVWKNDDHFEYYLFWFLSVISSWIAAVFRVLQLPERCIFKSALKKIIEDDGGNWKEYKRVMRKEYKKDCAQKVINNQNREQKEKLLQLSRYLNAAMEEDHICYYYFTSHQWWHIFVNLSVAFQMYAWVQYFRYREALDHDPCC